MREETNKELNMIGIIGAMDVEVDGFNKFLEDLKTEKAGPLTFYTGKLFGKEVVTTVCGIGKVAAAMGAEAMLMKYSPDIIINSGVGGGIAKGLKVGDVVIAEKAIQHDFDLSLLDSPKGFIPGIGGIEMKAEETAMDKMIKAAKEAGFELKKGTVVSGDQFIASSEKKAELVKDFGGTVCEMEGASIAQVCTMWNKPFAILRAVSDGGDDEANMSFTEFCDMAANNAIKVLKEFVKEY